MLRGLSVRGMFKNSKHWNFPCAWWCVANHRAVIKISIAPLPPDVYEVVLVRERAALGHAEISRAADNDI
jgi:hypothetical protein